MAFENQLQVQLENWLDKEFANRQQHITDGSCGAKHNTCDAVALEYREKCAELRMIRAMAEAMQDIIKRLNTPDIQIDDVQNNQGE